MAAVREALSPGQRGRRSASARRRSTSAARSTQKLAVNEESLRGAARLARTALAGRRRRQRRPGDDHRRLRPARAESHGSRTAGATNCWSRRASSRAISPSSRSATKRWSRSPPTTFRSTAGWSAGSCKCPPISIYDEVEKITISTSSSRPIGHIWKRPRAAFADYAWDDYRHGDHYRAQERAELFAQAGYESAQRGAERALIRAARRRGQRRGFSAEAMFTGERLRR